LLLKGVDKLFGPVAVFFLQAVHVKKLRRRTPWQACC
jgi:hypothetical protein